MFIKFKDKAKISSRVGANSEALCMTASCCMLPISRHSVLEALREGISVL